jgi:hypothetical protein
MPEKVRMPVSFLPVVGTDEEAAVAGYLSAGSGAAARATTKADARSGSHAGQAISSTTFPRRHSPSERLSRPSLTKSVPLSAPALSQPIRCRTGSSPSNNRSCTLSTGTCQLA